jgi:formylglycine-generating enzyme required for sulfatase activity/uncharacterized caspase-like protein
MIISRFERLTDTHMMREWRSFSSGLVLGLMFLSGVLFPLALEASERVALVIGNAAYEHAPLRNPVNDATDLAKALRAQGFTQVIQVNDADLGGMRRALRDFREALVGAELGLFYFAGHGAQFQGENYLIPVRSRIDAAVDLDIEALGAQQVLRQMESAGSRVNVVILDACRDNPYPAAARSGSRGLARVETVTGGSLIAFATAPGQVADDGAGRNSPYAAALLRYLGEPLSLPEFFNRVGFAVTETTRGRQVPWYQASPLPPIRLAAISVEPSPPLVAPTPSISPQALELAFWQSIQNSREVGDFQAYLDQYPQGSFAALARARIAALQVQQAPATTSATGPAAPAPVRLSVKATPADARIRIMNIVPMYQDGMELTPGRYDLEISAWGYETHRRWYDLAAGDRVLEVALERIPAPARIEPTPAPIASTPPPVAPRPEIRPSTGTVHRDRLHDGTQGPEMVFIRGGTFMMGSPENEAGRGSNERRHRVSVGDVWIGRHAVTVGEFRRFVEASGHRTDAERNAHGAQGCFTREEGKGDHRGGRSWRNPGFRQDDSHPVVCVSWNDAQVYVQWLSAQTGQTYRLPMEAEWEYAARAGTTTARFWGNDPDAACAFANVHDETSKRVNAGFTWEHHGCDDRHPQTSVVGSFAPNAWGLHDVLGNVWEWTCSAFDAGYGGAEQRCDASGERRAVRGGSWHGRPDRVRSALRGGGTPGLRSSDQGLRLARSP